MIRSVPERDRKITEVHLSKPKATVTTTKPHSQISWGRIEMKLNMRKKKENK